MAELFLIAGMYGIVFIGYFLCESLAEHGNKAFAGLVGLRSLAGVGLLFNELTNIINQ